MINYIEKGHGLHTLLRSLGIEIFERDGVWHQINSTDDEVNTIIQNYNPWRDAKREKLAEIDADFSAATTALTAGWPEHEIKTWSKQEAEARAYLADDTTPTPMLSSIATQRGITIHELAIRVIRDADAFTAASGYYVGLRHKARQQVQAFSDDTDISRLPELQSIKFGN